MSDVLSDEAKIGPAGASLYETDFFSWTREQARLLRSGKIDLIDVSNLAEEIDTLGRSEAAALRSSYRLISMHLLKMLHQPERATASWENSVNRERLNVETALADNPGLKPRRAVLFAEGYELARREAAFETKLDQKLFPVEPPFDIVQAESYEFWPEGFPLKQPLTPGTPGALAEQENKGKGRD